MSLDFFFSIWFDQLAGFLSEGHGLSEWWEPNLGSGHGIVEQLFCFLIRHDQSPEG
jgi:hypothetical protein